MENYTCVVCGKEIENFRDGLFVKIEDQNGRILNVIPVHKGKCDDDLCKTGRRKGLNTNRSMEISFFSTEEERKKYLNGTFDMTNEQFFHKFFNDDGTLKQQRIVEG